MTTVSFLRDARGLCGIRVSGHAGYAPAGEDIVCAAASVLPGGLSPASEHDARIILRTAEQGFLDIAAQYPSYLQII